MPHLRIIYDFDNWAFHRRAQALARYAPRDFEVSMAAWGRHGLTPGLLGEEPVDVLLVLPVSLTPALRDQITDCGWQTKLVSTDNSGWPRQVGLFAKNYLVADCTVFNNLESWEKAGRLPGTRLLQNGVDLSIFNVQRPIASREPRVLWVGSRYAEARKGYQHLVRPLAKVLRARGIACDLRLYDSIAGEKHSAEEMAEWYNTGTVLVCASRVEGTPNPALEAAASGCTLVSTRVGNMPELIVDGVNGYLVERNREALVDGVLNACDHYTRLAERMQADIQSWGWREQSARYFTALREVIDAPAPLRVFDAPRSVPDLRDQVTVFVATVGAGTFEACLERLRRQDSRFRLEIIDRVAPMSNAFQQMLDRCQTPFYVQVDEDMLLHPHAVRVLHQGMNDAASDVAILMGVLFDCHLERCIRGVKVFRHAVVRRYPFKDVESCEVDQVARLEADGYRIERMPFPPAYQHVDDVLGLHGAMWTPNTIYERYMTQTRKTRRRPESENWFRDHQLQFLERFREEPTELNFFALMGVLVGLISDLDGSGSEKDWRRYGDLPGWRLLDELWQDLNRNGASATGNASTDTAPDRG